MSPFETKYFTDLYFILLKARNGYLEAKLTESEESLGKQRKEIKQEYQNFVDQLQTQIESLVDQINRMSDEREAAFSKMDSMEAMLNKTNIQNDALITDLNEMKAKYDQAVVNSNQANNSDIDSTGTNKEQLLENEIKYFKQQIEILVQDHNSFVKAIDEKEQVILNLNKLVENYERERNEHGALLDQVHNEKQALSRAIQQNKDLKKQLEELQDAFVNVTQENLNLTTKLQSHEFSLKQMDVVVEENKQLKANSPAKEESKDQSKGDALKWDDDSEADTGSGGRNSPEKEAEDGALKTEEKENLMDVVKKRIQDLEKENQDLNDYITLVNKNLEKQQKESQESTENKSQVTRQHNVEQEEIIDRQLKKVIRLHSFVIF